MRQMNRLLGVLLTFLLLATSSGVASATDTLTTTETESPAPVTDQAAGEESTTTPDQQDDGAAPLVPDQPAPVLTTDAGQQELAEDETVPADTTDPGNPATGPPAPVETTAPPAPALELPAPAANERVEPPATDTSAPEDTREPDESAQFVTAQATDAQLVITVTDFNTSAAVAGATVAVKDYNGDVTFASGTTDASGVFSATLPLGDYWIDISASGYYGQEFLEMAVLDPDIGDSAYAVGLLPVANGSLTIAVVSFEDGSAIANARVTVLGDDSVPVTIGTTDADGIYVTGELAAGWYSVEVSADGFATRSNFDAHVNGPTTYEINLNPIVDGELTIVVTDSMSDDIIANASVAIYDADSVLFTSGTTNDEGKLVVAAVPGGRYYADTSAAGYHDRTIYEFDVVGNTLVSITLSPVVGGTITIHTFIEYTSTAISGASVVVQDQGGATVASGTTDSKGTFVSAALAYGYYDVHITAPGYVAWFDGVTVDGGAERNAYLRPITDGVITLTVLDNSSDTPIPGATVTVTNMETSSAQTATTDASGVVSFTLGTGYYGVEITASGYASVETSRDVSGDDSATYYMTPTAPGTLAVTIRDRDTNALLAGVTVEIRVFGATPLVASGTTDANGAYTSPELPDGLYEVTLTRSGYSTEIVSREVRGNTELTTSLQALHDGILTVHVLEVDHDPIANAQVTVTAVVSRDLFGNITLGDVVADGTTDATGKYVTPSHLASGEYMVNVAATGYEPATGLVAMNGDAVRVFNLETDGQIPVETPDPSETPVETPVTTPDPSETPVTTPDASETPATTPDPSETAVETPDPSETPVETPDPSETPVETPDPSETPVETPVTTPDPSETPATTPEPSETPVETPVTTPAPAELAPLTVSMAICANDDCAAPHNTDLDGFTATWTVTGEDTALAAELDAAKAATTGRAGAPVRLALMQQQSFTLNAVIQDGVASATSEPLPTGIYNVCLQPLLAGPNGETLQIADGDTCTLATLTADGAESDAGPAFHLVITEESDEEPTDPTTPAEPSAPTLPDAGHAVDAPASSADSTEAGTRDHRAPAASSFAVVVSADADTASGATAPVSGLPSTGAGPGETATASLAAASAIIALILLVLAQLIRQRAPR